MDEGKILIVNLSKGLIGEDNAGILGAFLVTKIQLAAMSRSDIPNLEDRKPFYLYVDEFQNFATDSFATILSEARKYALNLTVANQYISQMQQNVRDAVFGNVGTTISFRVSADDAPMLSKQFEPQFEAADLLQMHNRSFIINMVIKGEKTPAFSATTLTIPTSQTDYFTNIVDNSRLHYSRDRAEVEEEIRELISPRTQSAPLPQSTTQAKTWPIDAGARPARHTQSPSSNSEGEGTAPLIASHDLKDALLQAPASASSSDSDEKPKRKRTRSRSRSKKGGVEQGNTPRPAQAPVQAPPRQSTGDPTELRLHH